jgi:hypothetical protein
MKKIKATEIVLFVCLLASCFFVPRFVTSQLLSGITITHYRVTSVQLDNSPVSEYNTPFFPEGGWFEQAMRVGLIGLTVFYAFRVAKRIDKRSLPPTGEDKGR